MVKVVGISFKSKGKMYYFSPNDLKISKGMNVIVETEKGLQFGTSETNIEEISEQKIYGKLKNIIRIASPDDKKVNEKNILDAEKAIKDTKRLVGKNKLEMQIIDANFTFDRSQLLIKFLADNRIDFRNLAKELASIYKTRIELRQVGARDKAKEISGCGLCGRQFCCSKFLNDLESVSINMAKNQNISLNPNKINGACGRLLCCLKYEDDCYQECRKSLPLIGKKIKTPKGEGKVIGLNILKKKYTVDIKDQGIFEFNIDEKD